MTARTISRHLSSWRGEERAAEVTSKPRPNQREDPVKGEECRTGHSSPNPAPQCTANVLVHAEKNMKNVDCTKDRGKSHQGKKSAVEERKKKNGPSRRVERYGSLNGVYSFTLSLKYDL